MATNEVPVGGLMKSFMRTLVVGAVLIVGGGAMAFAASPAVDEITSWNQMLDRKSVV